MTRGGRETYTINIKCACGKKGNATYDEAASPPHIGSSVSSYHSKLKSVTLPFKIDPKDGVTIRCECGLKVKVP